MNIDWNSVLPWIIVAILIIFLAILFREPLKLLLRRTREIDYDDKSGRKLRIKADKESSLPQPLVEKANPDTTPVAETKLPPPVSFSTSKLPDKLYENFVGREKSIYESLGLLRNPSGSAIIGITGYGGVGKTALARELAERALGERIFHAAYWVTAKRISWEPGEEVIKSGTEFDYDFVLQGLVNWLGLGPELRGVRERPKREERIKETLDASPSLLILDNLETANENQDELAVKLGKLLHKSRAIFTSREKWDPTTKVYPLCLTGFDEFEAVRFMKSFASDVNIARVEAADATQLRPLVKAVGGLPLALKLVAGMLADYDVVSVESSLKKVETEKVNELYRYLLMHSWQQLAETHKEMLIALAQYSEDIGASAADLRAMQVVPDSEFNSVIHFLRRKSLVEVSGNIETTRYLLHPLTLNFVRKDLLNQRSSQAH